MKEFTYTITDPVGIHARPAGMLAKKAAGFKSTVTVIKGEKKADTRRLMALMGLGISVARLSLFRQRARTSRLPLMRSRHSLPKTNSDIS